MSNSLKERLAKPLTGRWWRVAAMEAERREALARIEELEAGWQPIETAPKDGTAILIWSGKEVAIVYWWQKSSGEEGYGVWSTGYVSGFNATHWMPLPEPPPAEQQQGDDMEFAGLDMAGKPYLRPKSPPTEAAPMEIDHEQGVPYVVGSMLGRKPQHSPQAADGTWERCPTCMQEHFVLSDETAAKRGFVDPATVDKGSNQT